jgi:hypothetical protein
MKEGTVTSRCTAQTAKGKPCRNSATYDGLCATHAGVARPGRKTKLDQQTADRLLAVLRAGGYDETACAAAQVSRQQFYEWLRRGRAGEALFAAFLADVERARAEGESRNVLLIAQQAQHTWQAAAWLLERRHPERWARVSQRSPDAPAANAAMTTDDPFAEVDELARRRRRP